MYRPFKSLVLILLYNRCRNCRVSHYCVVFKESEIDIQAGTYRKIKTVILKVEEISLVVENLPSANEVLSSTSTGSISLKTVLFKRNVLRHKA